MADLPRPVTMMIWSQPAAMASSTPYWMMGLSTSGSISFGCALVAGRKRVPQPAAGKTAFPARIEPQGEGSGGGASIASVARGPRHRQALGRVSEASVGGQRPCEATDRLAECEGAI